MAQDFDNRPRFTEEEARRDLVDYPSAKITHLISNDDGTFSLLGHIVCEYCDYCEEQGDCRGNYNAIAFPAKEDPYENETKKLHERYGD